MLVTLTRCRRTWPWAYRTYYQETEPPYRRADNVLVLRFLTWGLVIGRWSATAEDEYHALLQALGARTFDPIDEAGHLREEFHRDQDPFTYDLYGRPRHHNETRGTRG